MGRAVGGAFQNGVNNFRSQNPPQGGFSGKGGAQQPQGGMGGMGGKGKGGAAQQPLVQQPQGGMGGKGGQQQQNPYANQYYQPQFQPETFNNPYAQGGFGQQPQMGGMGGKGGQMGGYPQQGFQGGMGGKGGQMDPRLAGTDAGRYAPQGGMGGMGGQRDTSQQAYNQHMAQASYGPGGAPSYEQWAAQRQSPDKWGPILQKPGVPQDGMGGKGGQMPQSAAQAATMQGTQQRPIEPPANFNMLDYERGYGQPQGGMSGKGGQMNGNTSPRSGAMFGSIPIERDPRIEQLMQSYRQQMMQPRRFGGIPINQPSGLAALQQPTATTQAATPAPEQPYMGNGLQE